MEPAPHPFSFFISIELTGMFNTGTNPFAMYIESNCVMPHNTHDSHGGTRWQVPWGKHTLASRKWTNTAGHDYKVNKTNVLPVAIVRDPYSWMQSMVRWKTRKYRFSINEGKNAVSLFATDR